MSGDGPEALSDLLALEACFPEPGCVTFTPYEKQALALQQATGQASELGATLHLPGNTGDGSGAVLTICLPPAYPQHPPRLSVRCEAGREASARLQAVVQGVVEDAQGLPCLVSCATALADALQACRDDTGNEPAGNVTYKPTQSADEQIRLPGQEQQPLVCLVIWFHHIKSLTKRKTIVAAARDLGIGGFCKPGFPGVIVAEGTSEALQAYTATLRALRWSAMSLRGSESGGAARRLQTPLREVPGEGMSELAAACRTAGVEQLLLSSLNLPSRNSGE